MNISFITTVYNEGKTIDPFLSSLLAQSKAPNEVIIVDGDSKDETVAEIKKYQTKFEERKITVKVFIKRGNRSIGRNEAIRKASGGIIVCSDSGNILDKKWIQNIIKPFKDNSVDIVAGYYKGLAKNAFQKSLVPFVLVMEDKIDSNEFLPATRSVAFKKTIWKKVGEFDERYSHNEDFVFARKLKNFGAKMAFTQEAIVYWLPRQTFKEAYIMFFRFALGDAEAGIFRTSVLLLFARYFLGFYFIFLGLLYHSLVTFLFVFIGFMLYLLLSIKKNYRYVQDKKAFFYLPLLQVTADAAVLTGTIMGVLKSFVRYLKI